MLPAEAYTSDAVLAWEQRHLFAGSWTCLGRVDDLFPAGERGRHPAGRRAWATSRRCVVRDADGVRMFANTCRHRGHELLPRDGTSQRRSIVCPYHAWTYDLGGTLVGARGFREDESFRTDEHGLVELPVQRLAGLGLRARAARRRAPSRCRRSRSTSVTSPPILAPYACDGLVLADRHSYEVAANWKVIAENYHECYHCPLIHPELCQITPPESGDNYHLPGAWIGGSMDLRDGMATMSLTGELAGTPLPGVDPTRVEYVHLLPNLLVSAHPDYVMAHRMVPLAPDRTWVECSWFVVPGPDGSAPKVRGAVEFWDITNKQDWAACESVQRGLASPHFRPGPFAPKEDAVADLVATIGRAYTSGRFEP